MSLAQYEPVRELILEIIENYADDDGTVLLRDMVDIVQDRLGSHPAFPGRRLRNYTTYTKVDLEARRLIERVPGASPQRLRRASPG